MHDDPRNHRALLPFLFPLACCCDVSRIGRGGPGKTPNPPPVRETPEPQQQEPFDRQATQYRVRLPQSGQSGKLVAVGGKASVFVAREREQFDQYLLAQASGDPATIRQFERKLLEVKAGTPVRSITEGFQRSAIEVEILAGQHKDVKGWGVLGAFRR